MLTSVKGFQRLVLVVCLLSVAGCMYQGRLKRGIFPRSTPAGRIDASVLVLSDKIIPTQISVSDPQSASLYGFTLEVADGVAVAVADALATLFTRVDAGSQALADQYDFTAEVKLLFEMTRTNCAGELQDLAVVGTRQDGLCTQLTLTLRSVGDERPLETLSSRRWTVFAQPGAASVLRWINEHTLYLFSPVAIPLYTQLQGNQLRRNVEQQIKEILQEQMKDLSVRGQGKITPTDVQTR